MRNSMRLFAAVGVALMVVSVATAQPPQRGQRGGGFGGNRATPQSLLANEEVQKELKLTDERKEKVKAFAPAQAQGGRGGAGGGAGGNRRRGQGDPGSGQPSEQAQAAEKFVKESLTADQQKRFKQIRVQIMGLPAFADEDVQSALKFTDEQKTKIKTLVDDYNKDVRELMPQRGQGGGGGGGNVNFQEIAQKREALTKTYTEKAQALLTADQKTAWKDYIGAEFKLQARRPPVDR